MKKIINIICCLGVIGLLIYYIDPITTKLASILSGEQKVIINKENEFAKKNSYKYVQLTNDFVPYSYTDLLNIYYTVLNNGTETFTFYCPQEYTDCLDDVSSISKDDNILTHIASFVHPFNNFQGLKVKRNSTGEVTISITHLYTEEEIEKVSAEIDRIIKEIITPDMDDYTKIKTFHDYIINNTKYDSNFDSNSPNNDSSKATGLLFNHLSVCGGYADVMAIFLSKININNFKVASDSHVWNAVYLNNEWLHIDLTWDDPVILDSEENTLLHKFFLINTEALKAFETGNHNFDTTIYQEVA